MTLSKVNILKRKHKALLKALLPFRCKMPLEDLVDDECNFSFVLFTQFSFDY